MKHPEHVLIIMMLISLVFMACLLSVIVELHTTVLELKTERETYIHLLKKIEEIKTRDD